MNQVYIQSGTNLAIPANSTGIGISLANTTKHDLILKSYSLKYKSSVSGLESQKFTLRTLKGNNLILHVGESVIGAEGTPIDIQPISRKLEEGIIIPSSDGITLQIEKSTVSIDANSIFLLLEMEVK